MISLGVGLMPFSHVDCTTSVTSTFHYKKEKQVFFYAIVPGIVSVKRKIYQNFIIISYIYRLHKLLRSLVRHT